MPQNPVYVSNEGLEKIKKELKYLRTTKTREVAERIETAKDLGDISENAEYAEAKDQYSWTQGRILELEDALSRIVIVKASGNDSVAIGCKVKVEVNGKVKDFHIVGSTEADPFQGRVSNESPIGLALIGLKLNETTEVKAPSGPITYKILEITC